MVFNVIFPYILIVKIVKHTAHWKKSAAAAAKSLQSCPTLCDPIDGSPPGSAAPGILQARTLEWVAISFSNAWKWKVKVKSLSRARLLPTPWTAAYQAPLSLGFSRQEYWSGVPLPSPWKKSNPFHTDFNNEGYFLAQIIGYPEIEWNSGFTGLSNLTMSSRIWGGAPSNTP